MKRIFEISVRSFVSHTLKKGDLESAFIGTSHTTEAIKAHQILQKKRPAEYTPEVSLSHKHETENFGYVFNAMLIELCKSAQTLAANEIASIEDIDRAWMGVMHTMVGPFGIMDNIGIDSVMKVAEYWANATKDPQLINNVTFLKGYVDKGHLGEKTGQGFYSYPNPSYYKFSVDGSLK